MAAVSTFCAAATAQQPPTLLEYPEGPVVNSNRVMGMGGAYVGVAEGADGHLYNPASFAYRYHDTRNDIWDWDWSLYWLRLPGKRNPDLYGAPGEASETFWFGGGLDLKVAGFGFGVHAYTQNYLLEPADGAADRLVTNTSVGAGLAYALHTLDITLGAYVYAFGWAVLIPDEIDVPQEALRTFGAGSRVGLLWTPRNRPVRIGFVYRTSFNATGLVVKDTTAFESPPSGVYLPGQLSIGGSFMAWERTYNPNRTWGLAGLEDERPAMPGDELRRYVLFSYDLVVKEAPPTGTLSMRGFLRDPDAPIPIRDTSSIGFRGGVESEVWANWLVLRGGYYFEPARTAVIPGRHHVTAGLAFRIPVGDLVGFWPWDLRIDGAVDVADHYHNFGVGVGFGTEQHRAADAQFADLEIPPSSFGTTQGRRVVGSLHAGSKNTTPER